MNVTKRNKATGGAAGPPDDVEIPVAARSPSGPSLFTPPPSQGTSGNRNTVIVAFVLAIAAVVIIVELFLMLSAQQEQFQRAVMEVERMHHHKHEKRDAATKRQKKDEIDAFQQDVHAAAAAIEAKAAAAEAKRIAERLSVVEQAAEADQARRREQRMDDLKRQQRRSHSSRRRRQHRQRSKEKEEDEEEEGVGEQAYYALLDNNEATMGRVKKMFESVGYRQLHPWQKHPGKWDVLWAWHDPFYPSKQYAQLTPERIERGQLVNRFPGVGFTTKSELVTSYRYDFVPPAFLFPSQQKEWSRFIRDTPGADKWIWVRKNTGHRGVLVTSPREAQAYVEAQEQVDIFVQRFVYPPHLIEGYKWDIGVYVAITSLEPLRVYYYNDLLLRFCKEPWPKRLDPAAVDTYVIADEYTSPWDHRAFRAYKSSSTTNVKQWMDRYFAKVAPEADWPSHLERHTTAAIRKVIQQDLANIKRDVEKWPEGQKHFFELYRFDFVFDSSLNPFLMEVNMSPNLSAGSHPHLAHMFDNLLRDLATLTGIDRGKKRRTIDVDEHYELMNAGDWKLIRN